MRYLLLVALILLVISPVLAKDVLSIGAEPVAAFCTAHSEGCRELATEVARVEMFQSLTP